VYQQLEHIDNNPVEFTGRSGLGETVVHSGGTYHGNFGNGMVLSADVSGNQWAEILHGTFSGHIETRSGMELVSNVSAHGTWELTENGAYNNGGPLSMDLTPTRYTCSGNTLREFGSASTIVSARVP